MGETGPPGPVEGRFDRRRAFSRTVGWVTGDELEVLARKTVAIAGLGGVGGAALGALVRTGVGGFSLADPDAFALENLNRQTGSALSTIGRPKIEVLAADARDVNPELALRLSRRAVGPEDVDAFLDGADVYVDGLDLFAMEARRLVFARCRARGIPAVTAGPVGFGVVAMCFVPAGMPFEAYFRLEGRSPDEQVLRFLVGMGPAYLQRASMVAPEALSIRERRAPSSPMGVALASGVAATMALDLLLGRRRVRPAPWSLQFDAAAGRARRTWRPWGNRNPWQRVILHFARKKLLPPG